MALTNFDEDQYDQGDLGSGGNESMPEPEKKPGNRTFLIAIAIVGVVFVLSLILLLMVAPGLLARQRAAQQEQAAQINAANTATAMAATANAQQQATTAVVITTAAPTVAALPTKTPVVVIVGNTPEVSGTSQLSPAELATVGALQTQMAGGAAGTPAPTSTALPTTGFADEVGLPLMGGLAVILVAIIIMSRRIRLSTR
jgi:cytoskeletal protein RodZ